VYSGQGVKVIAHFRLLLRLTRSGAIIVLPLHNFKWRAERTLPFSFTVDTKNFSDVLSVTLTLQTYC